MMDMKFDLHWLREVRNEWVCVRILIVTNKWEQNENKQSTYHTNGFQQRYTEIISTLHHLITMFIDELISNLLTKKNPGQIIW